MRYLAKKLKKFKKKFMTFLKMFFESPLKSNGI